MQHFFFLSNAGDYKLLGIFLTTDSRMNYVTKIISINNSAEFKGEEIEWICAKQKKKKKEYFFVSQLTKYNLIIESKCFFII